LRKFTKMNIPKLDEKPSRGQEIYEIVKDYSEYSTIQGVIYIFQSNQTQVGKFFWTIVIIGMVALGTYWSVEVEANDYFSQLMFLTQTKNNPIKAYSFTFRPLSLDISLQIKFSTKNLGPTRLTTGVGFWVNWHRPFIG
jgi:hypothetical protein